MACMTKTINTVQVGDVVTNVWGTDLAAPVTVTAVKELDVFGTIKRTMVYADNGAAWPARDNDDRPITVA